MNTTRYLIHTIGDQSLTAIAFVTEIPSSNTARVTILPVNLMRPQAADPIISLSAQITEDVPMTNSHEKMCAAILKKAGIPNHHQLLFHKVPEPMRLD
jgi:hypothetical protein